MNYIIALLVSAFLFCQTLGYAHAQQDANGNYINSCENFGAMAVAVVHVKRNKLMDFDYLIKSQTEYFKRSGIPDQDILDLIKMISYVYQFQDIAASDAMLFEYYGQQCVESRKDRKQS